MEKPGGPRGARRGWVGPRAAAPARSAHPSPLSSAGRAVFCIHLVLLEGESARKQMRNEHFGDIVPSYISAAGTGLTLSV